MADRPNSPATKDIAYFMHPYTNPIYSVFVDCALRIHVDGMRRTHSVVNQGNSTNG